MTDRRQNGLLIAAALLLLAVVAQSYRFVPDAFLSLGRLLLLAGTWLTLSGAFVGWGCLLLRALRVRTAVHPGSAWAAGAAATATIAGWLAPVWFPDARLWAPWLAVGLALALRQRRRIAWRRALPSDPLLLLTAPFLLAALVLALAPPLSLDSLVYHLALPKQFALAGRGFLMPWNVTSHFPLHAEMLYGLALWLEGSGRLAQLLHLTAAVASLGAVIELGRRHLGPRSGVWAAVILYTLPVLTLVSGWAWNDWFLLLYSTLALDAVLRLRAAAEPDAGLSMGLFLGAAAAVKYNALPLLGLFALVLPRLRPRGLAPAVGLVVAMTAPWYGRNLLATGNPVYPLLSNLSDLGSLVRFRGVEGGPDKWLGYLGRPDLLDESLGSLLAAALVLGIVFGIRRWRRTWPLFLVVAAYAVLAAVHHPTVRAFTPLLLAASLLAGGGLAEVWVHVRRPWILAPIALLLWVNFAQVLWIVREHRPSGVALGYQKVDTYLENGFDAYRASRWINDNTPAEARVMVVADSRIFYLDRRAVAGSYLDPHPLQSFLRPGDDLPAVAARLREAGIGYVLFTPARYRVGHERETRNELTFYAAPETDRVFRALLAGYAELIFRDGPVTVLKLAPEPLDRTPPPRPEPALEGPARESGGGGPAS